MQNPIITPRTFFDRVVVPDCEELKNKPDDVRAVFHASTSLHHLREWIFKAGLTRYKSLSEYSDKDLYVRCPNLKIIRDLASNAKHFPPDKGRAEELTIGVSAAPTGWGEAYWDVAQWDQSEQDQAIAKKVDGTSEWLIPIILTAYNFWIDEFKDREW